MSPKTIYTTKLGNFWEIGKSTEMLSVSKNLEDTAGRNQGKWRNVPGNNASRTDGYLHDCNSVVQ